MKSASSSLAPAQALVHRPVLAGRVPATYVAHRAMGDWFIGGPDFVHDDGTGFERVALEVIHAVDPSIGAALDLQVGGCAFRRDGHGTWQRGRIPHGQTFVFSYEVRPTETASEAGSIGGALAHCWVVARQVKEAERRALRHLDESGWVVVAEGRRQEVDPEALDESAILFFRQAQIDGLLCVLHTFPPEPADA